MRRLLLPLTPFVAIACDDVYAPASSDASADATDTSSLFAIEAPIAPIAPVIASTPTRASTAPKPAAPVPVAVHTLATAADRTRTLASVWSSLGFVPGLAEALATGQLVGPSEDGALPAALQAMSNAPWLLLEGRLVLAQDDQLNDTWAAGPAAIVKRPDHSQDTDDGLFVAKKPLAKSHLPTTITALAGATVRVFDHEQEVCVAKIGALDLEARLVHNPSDYDGEDGPSDQVEHDAPSVFENGVAMLLADLEPISGTRADCARGQWATPITSTHIRAQVRGDGVPSIATARHRLAALGDGTHEPERGGQPTLFRAVAMDKKLSRSAVRAFRHTAEYQTRQEEFATFYDDEPKATSRWDANAAHTFARWLAIDGSREVLAVHADTWDGCGSNGQTMTALFDVHRDGAKTTLTAIAAHAWDDIPAGIVDVTSDGTLELMDDGLIYHWLDPKDDQDEYNDGYQELERLTVPDLSWYGCGC